MAVLVRSSMAAAMVRLMVAIVLTDSSWGLPGAPCNDQVPCDSGESCHPAEFVCYTDPFPTKRPHVWLDCDRKASDCEYFDLKFDTRHKRGPVGRAWCESGERVRCSYPPPAPNPPTPANVLNIVSYNIFERTFLVTYDGQRERTCRIPKNLIRQVGGDVDVVVFQEAFMGGCWAEDLSLRTLMSEHGFPYATKTIYDNTTIENGGVFIASRWPILDRDRFIFKNWVDGSADMLASKGVGYAKIQKTVSGSSRVYHVFGTHMQAGGPIENREKQVQEWGAFLATKKILQTEGAVFAGDFNTGLYSSREALQRMMDTLNAGLPTIVGPLNHTTIDIRDGPKGIQWIDYVLYSKAFAKPSSATMQSFKLVSEKEFDACWCELCLPVDDYMYPDSPECPEAIKMRNLADHLPVKGSFVF